MIVYTKNCTFREWYNEYKREIITLFHQIIQWIIHNKYTIPISRKEFYRNFVYFVYKNSIPYIEFL